MHKYDGGVERVRRFGANAKVNPLRGGSDWKEWPEPKGNWKAWGCADEKEAATGSSSSGGGGSGVDGDTWLREEWRV